ncbi:loricrin-like [Panicum hallii]|uniref:loricrin-like n=1 Tax=Panicum hallii TaxID=206008 RepID=UPI000DF4E124|nr:loricrin-like [Panicum hallii]
MQDLSQRISQQLTTLRDSCSSNRNGGVGSGGGGSGSSDSLGGGGGSGSSDSLGGGLAGGGGLLRCGTYGCGGGGGGGGGGYLYLLQPRHGYNLPATRNRGGRQGGREMIAEKDEEELPEQLTHSIMKVPLCKDYNHSLYSNSSKGSSGYSLPVSGFQQTWKRPNSASCNV